MRTRQVRGCGGPCWGHFSLQGKVQPRGADQGEKTPLDIQWVKMHTEKALPARPRATHSGSASDTEAKNQQSRELRTWGPEKALGLWGLRSRSGARRRARLGLSWANTASLTLHNRLRGGGPESHTLLASTVDSLLFPLPRRGNWGTGRHCICQVWMTLKPTTPLHPLTWKSAGLSSGPHGQSQGTKGLPQKPAGPLPPHLSHSTLCLGARDSQGQQPHSLQPQGQCPSPISAQGWQSLRILPPCHTPAMGPRMSHPRDASPLAQGSHILGLGPHQRGES